MSLPEYTDVYNNFDPAALEADILDGRLDSGLNVCHEICDKWADDPSRVALYYETEDGGDGTLTFAELQEASARFANYLKSKGIGKGDRVAALLPRTPELLIVIAGTCVPAPCISHCSLPSVPGPSNTVLNEPVPSW